MNDEDRNDNLAMIITELFANPLDIEPNSLRETIRYSLEAISPVVMVPMPNGCVATHYGPPAPLGTGVLLIVNTDLNAPANETPFFSIASTFSLPKINNNFIKETNKWAALLNIEPLHVAAKVISQTCELYLETDGFKDSELTNAITNMADLLLQRINIDCDIRDHIKEISDDGFLPGAIIIIAKGRAAYRLIPIAPAMPEEVYKAMAT
jgi:hypothetical protein